MREVPNVNILPPGDDDGDDEPLNVCHDVASAMMTHGLVINDRSNCSVHEV